MRLVGVSLAVGLVTFWIHPWTGLTRLGVTAQGHVLQVRAVSTGVLPIRVADAHGGASVRMVAGQVAVVPVGQPSGNGGYQLSATLALTHWQWLAAVLVCLLPLIGSCTIGLTPGDPPPANDVLVDDAAEHHDSSPLQRA